MNTIATPDPDSNSPRRLLPLTIILPSSHDEDPVTADTKAGKCALALLTHIAMDRHEILRAVYQDHARLRLYVRKQPCDKLREVNWKWRSMLRITPCWPVILFSKRKPSQFCVQKLLVV